MLDTIVDAAEAFIGLARKAPSPASQISSSTSMTNPNLLAGDAALASTAINAVTLDQDVSRDRQSYRQPYMQGSHFVEDNPAVKAILEREAEIGKQGGQVLYEEDEKTIDGPYTEEELEEIRIHEQELQAKKMAREAEIRAQGSTILYTPEEKQAIEEHERELAAKAKSREDERLARRHRDIQASVTPEEEIKEDLDYTVIDWETMKSPGEDISVAVHRVGAGGYPEEEIVNLLVTRPKLRDANGNEVYGLAVLTAPDAQSPTIEPISPTTSRFVDDDGEKGKDGELSEVTVSQIKDEIGNYLTTVDLSRDFNDNGMNFGRPGTGFSVFYDESGKAVVTPHEPGPTKYQGSVEIVGKNGEMVNYQFVDGEFVEASRTQGQQVITDIDVKPSLNDTAKIVEELQQEILLGEDGYPIIGDDGKALTKSVEVKEGAKVDLDKDGYPIVELPEAYPQIDGKDGSVIEAEVRRYSSPGVLEKDRPRLSDLISKEPKERRVSLEPRMVRQDVGGRPSRLEEPSVAVEETRGSGKHEIGMSLSAGMSQGHDMASSVTATNPEISTEIGVAR